MGANNCKTKNYENLFEFKMRTGSSYDLNKEGLVDGPLAFVEQHWMEYIECVSVVRKGKGFLLRTSFPYREVFYRRNLWGTKNLPYLGGLIKNPFCEKMKKIVWPEGITISNHVSELKALSDLSAGITGVQYISYELTISERYSSEINMKYDKIMERHKTLIEKIVNDISLEYDNGYKTIYIYKDGITKVLTKTLFCEYGLTDLPNMVYQFTFAKKIAESVYQINKEKYDFKKIGVDIDRGRGLVSISFVYDKKNDNLKSW